MKKIIFTMLTLLSFALVHAEENSVEIGQPLGQPCFAVLNLVGKEWFIGLEDESYWQLMPLKNKPKQSWHEWWHGQKPAEWGLDNSFFFDPATWQAPVLIQVYEARSSLYPGYSYVLENVSTGQRAFAELVAHSTGREPTVEQANKYFQNPVGDSHALARNQHYMRGIIILNDDTIWKDLRTDDRAAAWQKWWNGVRLDKTDPRFVFELSGWEAGDDIQVYEEAEGNQVAPSPYGANASAVYLLENKSKGQLGYAVRVSLMDYSDACQRYAADSASKTYKDGYATGYVDGHDDGYWEGYAAGAAGAEANAQGNQGNQVEDGYNPIEDQAGLISSEEGNQAA